MTDIKDRFAGMLAEEPPDRDDIDNVIATGRRRLRRRTALVSVAGTAGTAAVTAAIVVPLVVEGGGSAPGQVVAVRASTQPTKPPCGLYFAKPANHRALKRDLQELIKRWQAQGRHVASIHGTTLKGGVRAISVCSVSADGTVTSPASPSPTPTGPAVPKYHYTDNPQAIATRFGSRLADLVGGDGQSIVFTRPFAQETSKLESGHPSYYDGNVDVTTGNGNQGDIAVQVTHAVTGRVPFDGHCNSDHCVQTTLADGSVLQTDQIRAGKGTILTAEIHHPNGLVVETQGSDYGFGPDAPVRTYGAQPLTLDQLTAIAEDPAFSF